jgi:hypothetical protein
MKDILGIYEYTYHDSDPKWDLIKHVITINSDTTYFHKMYHKDALLLEEQGIYNFNRFVPGIKFIEFTAYDKYLEIVSEVVIDNIPNGKYVERRIE